MARAGNDPFAIENADGKSDPEDDASAENDVDDSRESGGEFAIALCASS